MMDARTEQASLIADPLPENAVIPAAQGNPPDLETLPPLTRALECENRSSGSYDHSNA
jgi:hypothetical protein